MSDERWRDLERQGDAVGALRERERLGLAYPIDVWCRDSGWEFLDLPVGLLRFRSRGPIGVPSMKVFRIQ